MIDRFKSEPHIDFVQHKKRHATHRRHEHIDKACKSRARANHHNTCSHYTWTDTHVENQVACSI